MNKIELRVVMAEFNRIANRLLQSDFRDYLDDLKKFVSFLDSTEIISQYINNCGGYDDTVKEKVQTVIREYHSYFARGSTQEEEICNVYSVIKCLCEDYDSFPLQILTGYSTADKYNDRLKAFNDRFVSLLIDDIDNYLTKVGIRMGMDDNVVYNISGNQVNIANDNATINAVQNNTGVDVSKIRELISAMRNELSPDLSEEDKKDASECIDNIEAELVSDEPDEDKVNREFKLLKRIDAGTKFASACCALLTFADKIHPFLGQILPWFQALIK